MKRLISVLALSLLILLSLTATTALAASVTLSWQPSTENDDGTTCNDLAGYIIYYGSGSSEFYDYMINVGNILTYEVTDLTPGETYFFATTAYDISGNESRPSDEVSMFINESANLITIPYQNMSIVSVDSANPSYSAKNAIDGDTLTFWHTEWTPTAVNHPHEIVIDIGSIQAVAGLKYLPRQDGKYYGYIRDYRIYVSTDLSNWGNPVVDSSFLISQGDTAQKSIVFSGKLGRYVKFVSLSNASNTPYAAAAEINVEVLR